MDCLQLPFIRVEEAVSWTQKNLAQKSKFIYDKKIWKQMFAEILRFKWIGTTQQTFSAINLASQQNTTKLFFSFQVRKQFKL